MTDMFGHAPLNKAIDSLRKDILADGGPRISTMRNYRFAILPYDPDKEFELRRKIRYLSDELQSLGWNVLSISLKRLFMDRLKSEESRFMESIRAREKRLYEKNPQRALNHLKEKMEGIIEEPDGIASAVVEIIDEFADNHPDQADRTIIFIGRAGALYPFFRSSALLKYIDGKTRNMPVVLLYPGKRMGLSALSFMGELAPDRDYRPRIYS